MLYSVAPRKHLQLHLLAPAINLVKGTEMSLRWKYFVLQLPLSSTTGTAPRGSFFCSRSKRWCARIKSPGLYAQVAITAHMADPRSSRKVKTYTLCAAADAAASPSVSDTVARAMGCTASAPSSSNCMKKTRAFRQVNFHPEEYTHERQWIFL